MSVLQDYWQVSMRSRVLNTSPRVAHPRHSVNMKTTIVNDYNPMTRIAIFGVSNLCLTFNHCSYILVGSENILRRGNKTKCTFDDKCEEGSTCSLLGNLV